MSKWIGPSSENTHSVCLASIKQASRYRFLAPETTAQWFLELGDNALGGQGSASLSGEGFNSVIQHFQFI
jgi:hypothetical protein